MKKRKQIGRKYNTGGATLSPLSTPSSMPQGASTSSGSGITTRSTTGGSTYTGGGSFDSGKLSSIGNMTKGITSSMGNIYSSDNPYGSFVLGDSTQDPITRLMGNLTGSNLDNAQTSLNNTVNNVNSNLQDISSSDALLNAWNDLSYLDTIEAPTWGERIGDHLLAGVQGANQGMSVGGPWGALIGGIVGNVANIGSQFTENANRNKLNDSIEAANNNMTNNFNNAASNLSLSQNRMAQANYAAYGGNLTTKMNKNPYNPYNLPIYAFGGNMKTTGQHGGEFSNGITHIGQGGNHEQNPLGGVPMGTDAQGIPNLVEEGEIKYNNYIFSDRLKIKDPSKFNLPKTLKGKSFAEAADKLQKESSERPNDNISKAGLNDSMGKLQIAQEEIRMKKNKNTQSANMFNDGGDTSKFPELYFNFERMTTDDFYDDEYKNAVKMLGSDDAYFNRFLKLLNSGIWGDTGNNSGKWTSDNRQAIIDRTMDYKKGPIHNALKDYITRYKDYHSKGDLTPLLPFDTTKQDFLANPNNPSIPKRNVTEVSRDTDKTKLDSSILRYAPALGAGIFSLTDALGLTNKPDYTNVDAVSKAIGNIQDVNYDPISNYLQVDPVSHYLTNRLSDSARATDRSILRSSNGNRAAAMAGLMANNYATTRGIGDTYLQTELYNTNQRKEVEGFNRDTNKFNSQMDLQAQNSNIATDKFIVSAKMQEAQMRDNIANSTDAARSLNLTNFLDSLGGIGSEQFSRNMINNNTALDYGTDFMGNNFYKKACGGKLKTKRK